MGIAAALWLLKGNIHGFLSHLVHNGGATQSDIMVPM